MTDAEREEIKKAAEEIEKTMSPEEIEKELRGHRNGQFSANSRAGRQRSGEILRDANDYKDSDTFVAQPGLSPAEEAALYRRHTARQTLK
jgi:hypothetical protein